MAQVKIEVTLSTGEKSIIAREIADSDLSTFDKIEDFTTQLKRGILPDLQASLLLKSQDTFKKKQT